MAEIQEHETVDPDRELIDLLQSKLDPETFFTRADILNVFDRLQKRFAKDAGSDDPQIVRTRFREWATQTHSSRVTMMCQMFRGDFTRDILLIAKQKVAKDLEGGKTDYFCAEWVKGVLDSQLQRRNEEE